LVTDEVRKLVKHSGIYGLGVIASKAIGFLMIPVYTRFLVPRDYGILELLDLLVFFATNFAALGIYGAVFRFYAAYDSEDDKKEVISTALFYTAAGSLVVAAGIIIWAPQIGRAVLGSPSFAPFVRIVALTFFFSNLCEVPLAYWRAQERSVLFVSVSLLRAILGATALAFSLAVLKWGVKGVLYANLTTCAISGLTLFGLVLFRVPKRMVREKLAEMLRYGAPLVISGLASFILVYSDRFFLRRFGNLTDVGVYGLGYKLAMIVTLVVSGPFSLTWQWQQFELAKKENAKDLYPKIQTYQFLFTVFVGLTVAVLAKDLLRIVSPASYWGGARIVPLIVLCYVLEALRSVMLTGILVRRVTHYLVPIAAIVAFTNLILNYTLISRFLAMGAAVATLISYAVLLALTYGVAQRVYFLHYEYGRNAATLGSAVLFYLVSTLFDLPIRYSIGVNIVLLFLFVLTSIRLLSQEERTMFLQMGSSVTRRLRETLARAE
jgi:O-antigen/teichoic acid export membrane protein